MSVPTEYMDEQDQGVAEIELADGTQVPLTFPARTIIVTHQAPEKSGNRGGKPWTLFLIYGTEADGTPLTLNLRTFDTFVLGEPVEVTMEAFVKNGMVEHYTVKPVKRPRKVQVATREPKATPLVPGKCEGCHDLETRVAALERRITAALRGLED